MGKSYAPEFWRSMIQRVRDGRSAKVVTTGLRVSEATVFRRVAQDREDHSQQGGMSRLETAELARAHRRMGELATKLAVVRTAVDFFASVGAIRPKAGFW